jgi:hypothetical protein
MRKSLLSALCVVPTLRCDRLSSGLFIALIHLFPHSSLQMLTNLSSKVFQYHPDMDLFKSMGNAQGNVRNNHCRGGQSQNRYQRLRENDVIEMVKKIAGLCERTCLDGDKLPLVHSLILVVCLHHCLSNVCN